MPEAGISEAAKPDTEEFKKKYTKAFETMLLARILDDKFASLYRAGNIHGGVFLGRGQEALSVATGMVLQKGDVFAPLIRDQAGRLAFGESILDALRTYLGSPLGPMHARDGNVHRGRPKDGLLPMISHLGAMISVVNGLLMAKRMQGDNSAIGATSIGDGGTSTGAFHEAMNMASVEKLPLLLVVADNQFAYSTPTQRQYACADLVDRAVGYGVTGHSVDGTDLESCLQTLETAASEARDGKGPQLIVASLLRLAGHGEHDDSHYIPQEMKASAVGRDCLKVAEAFMYLQKWATPESMTELKTRLQNEVNETVLAVQKEAAPDPFAEDWNTLATKSLSGRH